MNFELKQFPSDIVLANAAAREWLNLVTDNKSNTVALSGGRIAKTFYDLIVAQAPKNPLFFSNVNFFWADERCVEPTNPESNFYIADQHLFRPLQIVQSRVHRLRGELDPDTAVANAITTISRIAPLNAKGHPVLDLVILGMGEDGHVASLFPNTAASVAGTDAPYLHVWNSPKPPVNRLSLSYAALAAAREVWVLASGAGKEEALKNSLQQDGKTPLGRVLASRQFTRIFTDIKV